MNPFLCETNYLLVMQLLCYARLLCNTRMFANKCFVSYCGCGALCTHFCASPSSREAYRDRRLTTNFELWVEIFCVPTCFHIYEDSKTLSVCPYPEKRNHPSFVNISPTLVIDTSMEMSSQVLQHGNPKIWFFFFFFFSKKFEIEFWLVLTSWNHLSFVNISPTLVFDTSMEMSSRVLHHGNPKMWIS